MTTPLDYPVDLPSMDSLKGQKRTVAEALLSYGYLDKEYALIELKVRNLHEIVARLRRDGWPIRTSDDNKRLYVLDFDRRAFVRKKAFGMAVAAMKGDTEGVLNASTVVNALVRHVGL